jgi:hypothetical protein
LLFAYLRQTKHLPFFNYAQLYNSMKTKLLYFLYGLGICLLSSLPLDNLQAQNLSTVRADDKKVEIQISEAYPNPAVDVLNFQYRLSMGQGEVKILVHNLLGTLIAEFKLNPYDTQVQIPVRDYKSGIYFYTLSVDNQSIVTKKFIVKH